jgi:hypothetical protein
VFYSLGCQNKTYNSALSYFILTYSQLIYFPILFLGENVKLIKIPSLAMPIGIGALGSAAQ